MKELILKIKHFVYKIKNLKTDTPMAIIIGAIILGISHITYAFILSSSVSPDTIENPLPKILREIEIDRKDFNECVDSGKMTNFVEESIQDGLDAGVTGTPTTFIIKEKAGIWYVFTSISGAQSYEYIKGAVDQAIATSDVSRLPVFLGKKFNSSDLKEAPLNTTSIQIVEYSDPECPYCIMLHDTMKKIRSEYLGKVSFIYRHFPLTQIHPHSQKESEMISCVGNLGGEKAYYNFIDRIFSFKIENNIPYLPTE